MLHRKPRTVIAVALVMVLLAGCAPTAARPSPSAGKSVIGLSMATLKEERWYIDRDQFVSQAKALGAEVYVDVAYDNAEEQQRQVKQLLSQGIDVLVLIPHDAQLAADAVALAKRAGVKVISYDRLVLKGNVDLYISFDNVMVGKLQAEAMLKAVPRGNYVIVDGPASDYNTAMISQGTRGVLQAAVDKGDIHIVKEFSTVDWMADEASDGINRLLQDGAKIDAVIAQNDSLAGGVINKLSEYHLLPKVPVCGMDADLAACQRVVEGQQLMTVYKPIRKLAQAAAAYAVKLARGEAIDVEATINDGKYDVPFVNLPPQTVDKNNMMDTVIADGFHQMGGVYLNVPKDQWPKIEK